MAGLNTEWTKAEIIDYCKKISDEFKEKRDKIVSNYEEVLRNNEIKTNRQIARIKSQYSTVMPRTDELDAYGMFLFKNGRLLPNEFAIAKKSVLNFQYYVLGRQVYELPKDMQVNDFDVNILAIFNEKKKILRYGVLNYRMEEINTFHSKPYESCLGENTTPIDNVTYDNLESVKKGIDEAKATIEVINPFSFLTPHATDLPKRLQPIMRFVKTKAHEYQRQRNVQPEEDEGEDRCLDCDLPMDECECETCGECGDRLNSDHYTTCHCERCNNCGEVLQMCECEHCEDCDVLLQTFEIAFFTKDDGTNVVLCKDYQAVRVEEVQRNQAQTRLNVEVESK